ncbi:restriction endonuclease [Rhizobium calliandrae]|uniref:Restriction endonuclease n=1 Tax=Rhizobium calliandrae TaxID=1312182 RepID=A0ABT7KFQ3_9HYPH|nr:restriction endonuclease [Rhizobium calliandrae]MDL2406818.1 restriction endonuclease [Rhizobium calliandrae]
MTIARTVWPIHFGDFSGTEFERLVFAYHLCDGWTDLAWVGQTGSDQGRDIVGTRPFDDQPDERTVIQCVNRGSLTQAKAEKDMAAAVKAKTGKPDAFKFVCRGSISAQRQDEVRSAAAKLGVPKVVIWSGVEV